MFRIQFAQKSFPNLRRFDLIRGFASSQVLACLPILEELSLPFKASPLELTPTTSDLSKLTGPSTSHYTW